MGSVVDRHRLDADLDSDGNQNDADPHTDQTQDLHMLKNMEKIYFCFQHCQFTMFLLSHPWRMCQDFKYF
jgi:hypothetical protein